MMKYIAVLMLVLLYAVVPVFGATIFTSRDLISAAERGKNDDVRAMIKDGVPVNGREDVLLQDARLSAAQLEFAQAASRIPSLHILVKLLTPETNGPGRMQFSLTPDGNAHFPGPNCSGCTALMAASSNGYVDIVKLLLEKGAKAEGMESGLTPLMAASFKGHAETAKRLIKAGASVNARVTVKGHSFTPLALAILGGSAETAKLLVESGAEKADLTALPVRAFIADGLERHNVDLIRNLLRAAALQDDRASLLLAAFEGDAEKVGAILKRSSIDLKKDPLAPAALVLGVYSGQPAVVESLLKTGAHVNAGIIRQEEIGQNDVLEFNPLFLASMLGNSEMVKALLQNGADAQIRIGGGETPLMTAAAGGYAGVVKLLLEKGADPNDSTENGIPVLGVAIGKPDIAKMLLEKGAKIHQLVPLKAALAGDFETVRLVLKKGADINIKDANGVTLLMCASSKKGSIEFLKYLLEQGADARATTTDGRSALDIAIVDQRPDMAKLLRAKGASIDADARSAPFINAVMKGDVGKIRSLSSAASLSAKIPSGPLKDHTALTLAVSLDDKSTVKALLQASATGGFQQDLMYPLYLAAQGGQNEIIDTIMKDPAVKNADSWNTTVALKLAAESGRLETVKKMIALGADVNGADIYGYTPLLYAAREGHAQIIQLLAEKGAKVNARANTGMTALILAASNGHASAVRELVRAGADPNVEHEDGFTAVTQAIKNDNAEMIGYLLKAGADPDRKNRRGLTARMLARSRGIVLQ